MSNISEKIKEARRLEDCLQRTDRTLKLLKNSQSITGQSKEINNLKTVEFRASICTGSQDVDYRESIYSDVKFTNHIADTIIPLFKEHIEQIKQELEAMFK